jgi:nucleoside phosphorylase
MVEFGPMNPRADLLLITVTKVESRAVMQLFQQATGQPARPHSIAGRVYHDLGQVNGTHVFMAQSEMGAGGIGAALQTVQKGIDALSPSAVIMVGIAFGVNDQKQAIGEILVSQQLWLYELQRMGKDEIIPRGDKPHASGRLLNYLRSADLYWDESKAKVSFGLILTGEKLVDSVDYRDQLRGFEREAIGGEMEGAGLYVACQDAHVDWILVKAICDWADGNKAEDKANRQRTAAENAAAFVLYTLQQAPLIRDENSPGGRKADPPSRSARRLQQELEGLQAQYDLLGEKIRRLRSALAVEASVTQKFQLEHQLKEALQEQEAVAKRLDDKSNAALS